MGRDYSQLDRVQLREKPLATAAYVRSEALRYYTYKEATREDRYVQ
jgi:hypothetical protein